MKSIFLFIIMSLTTVNVLAHESDREIQLKAANDELTQRVAELLDENAKLKAHAANIQQQMRDAPAGKPVVLATGCIKPNYEDFFDDYILKYSKNARDELVGRILESDGKNCSKQDLDFIDDRLIPEMYPSDNWMSRIKELMKFLKAKL